jgi:hypothetical protein
MHTGHGSCAEFFVSVEIPYAYPGYVRDRPPILTINRERSDIPYRPYSEQTHAMYGLRAIRYIYIRCEHPSMDVRSIACEIMRKMYSRCATTLRALVCRVSCSSKLKRRSLDQSLEEDMRVQGTPYPVLVAHKPFGCLA